MTNNEPITLSVSDRTLLWGRVGKLFTDAPATAEEAIVESGLDWDVELRPMGYHNAKGNFVVAPGNFGTVRTDTDALLGSVKSRYKTFSNKEAFTFADNLVSGAGASFESGWSTHGGSVVGLTMRLPETVLIGGEDAYNQYLALRTTHNGTGSIQMVTSMVRMACLNQFDGIVRRAGNKFTVRHTAKAGAQLSAAREALQLSFTYADEFSLEMEQLLNTELDRDASEKFLTAELETLRVSEKNVAKQVSRIFSNLDHSLTLPDAYRGTAYGLLNATSEYFQHVKSYRTDQAGYLVNTEGIGHKMVQRLEAHLVAA